MADISFCILATLDGAGLGHKCGPIILKGLQFLGGGIFPSYYKSKIGAKK